MSIEFIYKWLKFILIKFILIRFIFNSIESKILYIDDCNDDFINNY